MHARKRAPSGRVVARAAVGREQQLRYGRMAVVVALALAAALGLGRPAEAYAGWPLAEQARVALGFGEVYSAGEGDSSQHRGVDIEAPAGTRVLAPLAGRVTFAGSIPGVGGGRVTAVTIETSRGKLTLLPLEHLTVSRGSQVAEGDGIGTLAGGGDGSSPGTHVHVGAREGDLYVDPLGLITLPPPAPVESPGSAVGEGAGSGVGAGAPVVEAGTAVVSGASAGVSLAPRKGASRAHGAERTAAAGELAPGVSIAGHGSAPSAAEVVARRGSTPAEGIAGGVTAAAGTLQATVVTADGVVVAASGAEAPNTAAGPGWFAETVAHVRTLAARSLKVASLVLLGVMAGLGALWPLWRGRERKGSGKVLVSIAGEDVAAAPSR